MTKDLGKSVVGIARMTMSGPLSTSSAMGTDRMGELRSPPVRPIAASGLRPDGRQGHEIPLANTTRLRASVLCDVASPSPPNGSVRSSSRMVVPKPKASTAAGGGTGSRQVAEIDRVKNPCR